jgi:hypothetical protein
MKQAQLLPMKAPEHPVHVQPAGPKAESAAATLRRVVRTMNDTAESTWDGRSMADIVRIVTSCWASGWDVYPDRYTPEEMRAAEWGDVKKLQRLLSKRLGGQR